MRDPRPRVYDAVARRAVDELGSVDGQIEHLLMSALRDLERWPSPPAQLSASDGEDR